MEFQEPTTAWAPQGTPETPYLRAQQAWDERLGSARMQARNWRLAALAMAGVSAILAAGLIYQSSKAQVTPYVVALGGDGLVQSVGPATAARYEPGPAEIRHFLAQWITKVRSVPVDPVVARRNWVEAFYFVTAHSRNLLSAYAQQANPMARVGQEMVSVEVRSAVPLSPKTYHVRWVEHVVTREGAAKERVPMAGSFTIEFKAPTDERQILVNPLGLYVATFSWSREL